MNTWHYGSLPIARFDGKTIKPIPNTIDAILDEEYERRRISLDRHDCAARSAIERISERQQIERPRRVA